jgi:phasin family protein
MPDTQTIDPAEKAYAEASEKVVADKPAAEAVKAKPAAPKAKPVAKAPKAKRVAKPAAAKPKVRPARMAAKPNTTPTQRKDKTMATTQKKTEDLTAKIQSAVKDAQGRAKAALDKSQASLVDAGAFSKGNLEALVESGKILGSGLQAMTQSYVEEVKSAFATAQDDFKALTAVKSPSEFVELRRAQLRKAFDNAVAYNSKNAEAALKLANDAFQPLSNRVSLAVEKIKQAA